MMVYVAPMRLYSIVSEGNEAFGLDALKFAGRRSVPGTCSFSERVPINVAASAAHSTSQRNLHETGESWRYRIGHDRQIMHLPYLKELEEYELTAVCDASPKLTKRIAEHFGVPFATTDWREFVAHENMTQS